MSWAYWRPQFEEAIKGSGFSIEDVEFQIVTRTFQFWETEKSAMITETSKYPNGKKAIRSWWAAGDLEDIIGNLRPKLEAAAKASGCSEAIVESRPGWERALKAEGYEPFSVTVRKVL